MTIRTEEDLEAAILLELFLDCEPGEERELFLAELDDDDRVRLLTAVLETMGMGS